MHNGEQKHQCQDCGRQGIAYFEPSLLADAPRALLARLLVERIAWHGMCCAVGANLKWLFSFRVQCTEALPAHLHLQLVTCHGDVMMQRLAVEADDMSSVVHQKANKQWLWSAMEAETRQVLACHVGGCSRKSAKQRWAKLPQAYRPPATFYTDPEVVYAGVIPAVQHRAISQ